MADRVQHRRDTAARWAKVNPVLLEGEIGYVLDNPNQHKIGDGEHAWNDLPLRGFTGNIAQSFGDDENAVVSQKVVTEEKRRAENAEKRNSDAIAAEVTRAQEAEGVNAAAIVAEVERAEAAESALQDDIDGNTERITDEVKRAQEAEQTLVRAISGVAGRVTAIEGGYATDAELFEESERAKGAEGVNAAAIVAEVERAEAAEEANAAAIVAEVERAEAAESALQDDIDGNTERITDEVKRAQEAERTLVQAISGVAGRVTAIEGGYATDAELLEESERAQEAEGVNAAAIVAEVERAEAAESALQDDIDGNTERITDEVKRAQEAEEALSTEITEAENRVDERVTEVRDNLEAEVQARSEAVADLNANTGISEYPAFDPAVDYAVGDVVVYEGRLRRFVAEHAAGEWIGTDAEEWNIKKTAISEVISSVITLEGIAESGVLNIVRVGGFGYNTTTKKIYYKISQDKSKVIEPQINALYRYNNTYYKWNGEELTEELNISTLTSSILSNMEDIHDIENNIGIAIFGVGNNPYKVKEGETIIISNVSSVNTAVWGRVTIDGVNITISEGLPAGGMLEYTAVEDFSYIRVTSPEAYISVYKKDYIYGEVKKTSEENKKNKEIIDNNDIYLSQGGISSTSGNPINSLTRVRTNQLKLPFYISANEGYMIHNVYYYKSGELAHYIASVNSKYIAEEGDYDTAVVVFSGETDTDNISSSDDILYNYIDSKVYDILYKNIFKKPIELYSLNGEAVNNNFVYDKVSKSVVYSAGGIKIAKKIEEGEEFYFANGLYKYIDGALTPYEKRIYLFSLSGNDGTRKGLCYGQTNKKILLVDYPYVAERITPDINAIYINGDKEYIYNGEELVPLYPTSVDYGNTFYSTFFEGKLEQYNLFDIATISEDVYSLYDELVGNNNGYITKNEIGVCEDGQILYSYTFDPTRNNIGRANDLPNIVIIAGQHGDERASVCGLYYMMKDICENYNADNLLLYFRNYVRFVVVPVVNRWGFDNLISYNINRVNLNRNYQTSGWAVSGQETKDYSGAEAFDQSETRAIRDLVKNEKSPILIDFHTYGGGVLTEAQLKYVNWLSFSSEKNINNGEYVCVKEAGLQHIHNISIKFNAMYGLGQSAMPLIGTINYADAEGTAKTWAAQNRIKTLTFEGFNGFPNRDYLSEDTQKANEELIANYVNTMLSALRLWQGKRR